MTSSNHQGRSDTAGQSPTGLSYSDVARANTEAAVFYRARCRRCLRAPDLDGEEWRDDERAALEAVLEYDWLVIDHALVCDSCLMPEDVAS